MELLERTSFLRALTEYADEARQGDGRLVLLYGESGIGKTALLEARAALRQRARCRTGASRLAQSTGGTPERAPAVTPGPTAGPTW